MSLETADWVRAIERGLHLAASFSVFGAILFRTVLARPVVRHLSEGAAERFDRACTGLVWFSAEVALFAAAAWLLMQSAYMSLSDTVGGTFEAIPTVLFGSNRGKRAGGERVCGWRGAVCFLSVQTWNRLISTPYRAAN